MSFFGFRCVHFLLSVGLGAEVKFWCRLSQIVEEENGWQRRVRNLTDEALEREKLLKQSRTEVRQGGQRA